MLYVDWCIVAFGLGALAVAAEGRDSSPHLASPRLVSSRLVSAVRQCQCPPSSPGRLGLKARPGPSVAQGREACLGVPQGRGQAAGRPWGAAVSRNAMPEGHPTSSHASPAGTQGGTRMLTSLTRTLLLPASGLHRCSNMT